MTNVATAVANSSPWSRAASLWSAPSINTYRLGSAAASYRRRLCATGTMLSAEGFKVVDLGVNVTALKLVEKARAEQADIIGVSALLTTTMVRQREVIQVLEEQGLRGQVKVMVGGAPVTRAWADEIGADGFSEDAVGAVNVAKALVSA